MFSRVKAVLKIILVIVLLSFVAMGVWYAYRQVSGTEKIVVTEDVMVERIVNIGKLELVKYAMKDVIEYKEIRAFFLPDQRVLFVAVGEVTGCIDLTKVSKEDITRHAADSLTIYLPEPEICYVKLDHQRSRVYDISGAWWPGDEKQLVEGVYKLAEKRILKNATEMDVLGKTKENALTIFKPIVENMLGINVTIAFR